MKPIVTDAALDRLLNEEDYLLRWLNAGYTKAQRRLMRERLRKGELSQAKKDELLEACGFVVAVEKQWILP